MSRFERYGNSGGLDVVNGMVVTPTDFKVGNSLQTAYDWLKSSDRNTAMGALSASNRRTLVRTPGTYTGNLAADTSYIDVIDLIPGSVTDAGTITITATDMRTKAEIPRPTIPAPANYIGQTLYQENFDGAAWTDVQSRFNDSQDTTYVRSGTASLKLEKDNYAVISEAEIRRLSLNSLDLSNAHGILRVYLPADALVPVAPRTQALSYISLKLYDSTASYAKYNAYTLFSYTTLPTVGNGSGWYDLHFTVNWPTGTGSGGAGVAAADLTDICTIGIQVGYLNPESVDGPTIYVDQIKFYKPRNTKPLLVYTTDATYQFLPQLTKHLRGLSLSGSGNTARPTLLINTNATELNQSAHITTAQLKDCLVGNELGCYAEDDPAVRWAGMSPVQKKNAFIKFYNFCEQNNLPLPTLMAMSGTLGWTPTDQETVLGRYSAVITGITSRGNQAISNALADPGYLVTTWPPTTDALLTRVVDATTSNDRLTMHTGTWDWTGIMPIKFASTVPTVTPALTAGTIYWLKVASTSYGTLHPTYTDAVAGTNGFDFTEDTASISIQSFNSAVFGTQIQRWMSDKSAWVGFCHADTDSNTPAENQIEVGKFQADVYANLASNNEIQWLSFNALITGQGVTGL